MRDRAFAMIEVGMRQRTRRAAGVDSHRLAVGRQHQPEAVAAEAVHMGINHCDGGSRGDHRLKGVAAVA